MCFMPSRADGSSASSTDASAQGILSPDHPRERINATLVCEATVRTTAFADQRGFKREDVVRGRGRGQQRSCIGDKKRMTTRLPR